MTRRILAVAAVLALALPCRALASGVDLGNAVTAKRDTSRFLPPWMFATLEAGVSWMQSPQQVSDRYNPGVAFGGGLTAKAGTRLRLSTRLAYLDLPNGANGYLGGYYTSNGQVYTHPDANFNAFTGGHAIDGLVVAAVRPWRNLWVEGGGGGGYFASGYGDLKFYDGVTGELIDVPGSSGWGSAWTAGLRYDFTVRKREKLFVSAGWTRLERDGLALDFVPLGIGYRFD